jgi:hypothetical protein
MILGLMLLLACGSAFGTVGYWMSASRNPSPSTYRVDFKENSSHFTMAIHHATLSAVLPSLRLYLLSTMANFSIEVGSIPNIRRGRHSVSFILFVPINGNFILKVNST